MLDAEDAEENPLEAAGGPLVVARSAGAGGRGVGGLAPNSQELGNQSENQSYSYDSSSISYQQYAKPRQR